MHSSKDRDTIKRKLREHKAAISKVHKQQEKAQKAKEKLESQMKKKFGFGK